MNRIFLITSVTFFAIIMFLVSCGQTRPELIQIDPGFSEYISGYTSGMVQRKDNIRIELAEEIENLEDLPEEELSKLFNIEPAIEGSVVPVGTRIVEFVPTEPLPSNQFYTVKFSLDELVEVDAGFEDFAFQFATFSQKIEVDIDGLRNYGRYKIEYQKLQGTISTTDYEDEEQLKKTLRVTLEGKEVPFRFAGNTYDDRVRFVVDSIKRIDKPQTLEVFWDGTSINSFSKGSQQIKVSALGDFSVSDLRVVEEEDQKVELTFTDPLEPTQNLKGIVSIEGIDELSYKIEGNLVTVFLPNRFVGKKKIRITKGVKNIANANMLKGFERELYFHEAYPLVRMEGNGTILPNSQGLIFPFEAIALKSVDVRIIRIHENNVHNFLQVNDLDGRDELTRFGSIIAEKKLDLSVGKGKNLKQWNTHIVDLESLINAEPGAIYQVAIRFDKSDALCGCENEGEAVQNEGVDQTKESFSLYKKDEDWNEYQWHRYGFDGYSSWRNYGSDESPCSSSYYYGKAVKRNILASNIGMVFKLDEDKKSHVILSDMVSTLPIGNAYVAFYDYQKQLISSVTTDSKGMATVKLKKKPFLMIARKGSQRGYMKLADGHVNSLSKFDVKGEVVQKGVKGYLYAERGVWRPGDSLYLSFMLQDKHKVVPKNHPVRFEFEDPNGNVIYEISKTKNVNGVYDFRTATSMDAPTGSYRAKVIVGNKLYSKTCKVETVKPNRLKVRMEIDNRGRKDSCLLIAKWLHGASAKNLMADVQVSLSPMRTSFKGFKKYHFDSPVRNGRSRNKTVFHGELDSSGEAKFVSELSTTNAASGMLRAEYSTKIFEKSGNFSVDRKIASYSPFETYVGIKTPAASIYDNTLETNKKHVFNLVTVNKRGQLISGRKLNVRIYKTDWNWWYDGEDDMATFTARNSAVLVKDTVLTSIKGKSSFNYLVPEVLYGRYLITVTDKKSGHQTGKIVNFDWPYWSRANRTDNEFAAMLTFSTDKKKYVKGEQIKLSFPSPSKGRALISVETSEKVLDKFWIETEKGETTYEFPATANMAPNAYLHVTLIQPHNATKNDLPIRMYGVMPIQVDDPWTHLHPVISMPDKIRPESKTTVTIREDKGRKMTYTLAVVDDGLLDLTGFRTPQPWNTFYAREALGVKTWDMYDDVIGAYAGKLENLLSIGGDGSAVVGSGPKANRFKPMVKFLGPFELPAGGSKKHVIDIPNYVGSVRVMAIARDEESYGNAQKTVIVKKPLMVLATVPRVLGPGEDFVLPVNVFAMEKKVKNVKVKIELNGAFTTLEGKQKTIQFKSEGDEVVNFRLKTKELLGVGKIKVTASSGKEVAYQEIEVDIRPSNPIVYDVENYQLEPGKNIEAKLLLDGLKGTNLGTVEVSKIPSINLEKRLGYLLNYPHGCVEQTTSAVFPQLYLAGLTKLAKKDREKVDQNIKAGIERLQLFQTMDGGFSYWPGETYENAWGTNYAGHFLLEAEALGYRLPSRMKSRWIAYQKEQARNWSGSNAKNSRQLASEEHTQAYRLYLLALSNNQEVGAMNRMRENRSLSEMAKWRLASAYMLIGQEEVAEKLIQGLQFKVSKYKELSGSFGSNVRDKAVMLEVLGQLNKLTKGYELLKDVTGHLNSDRWLSTQETAYSLLSVAKFCKVDGRGNEKSAFSYSWNGESLKTLTIESQLQKISVDDKRGSNRSVKLKNTGETRLFVTVTVRKIPFGEKIKKKMSGLVMKQTFTDMDGNAISVNELEQGTEFIASVSLHNPSDKTWYKQMALNQLFPSGWEIHNSRLYGSKGISNDVRYQDIRDDRTLSYYALKPGETKRIKVILNATYQGRFFLPALYSEAMYDHSISALIPGKWIEVKE